MTICDVLPKLDKCCCCINLRLGGLIIAALILVFNVLGLIGAINLLNDNSESEFLAKVKFFNFFFFYFSAIADSDLWIIILDLGIVSLDILLSIFLFLGIITSRYHWLLPYLWVKGLLLLLYFALIIVLFFFSWPTALGALLGLCKY